MDTYGKWLPLGNKAAVDGLDAPVSEPSGSRMVASGGASERTPDARRRKRLKSKEEKRSWRADSNRGPADYETDL